MRTPPAPVLLLMGVSGCGKTEMGRRVAASLGLAFLDADDLHPAANVQKLRSGIPLSDADRHPWLDGVALALARAASSGAGLVVACSALKRAYRDRLREAAPDLRLVHLAGPVEIIRSRLRERTGHFMPAALLDSQLADLETPTPDERPVVVSVALPPDEIAAAIVGRILGSHESYESH